MQAEEKKYITMTKTPIPRLVVSLAIPTVLSQLISTIYNTADTYFVSKIGTSATAAVGVVFSLMSLIQAVGFGLGMGAGAIISRKLGKKDTETANVYASSAFMAAWLFGSLLLIAGLSFTSPMMRLLGSTPTMLPYANAYGKVILLGAPVMCSAFVLNNVLRSEGEARLAVWGLTMGGILNMILDPIFIFTLDLGIKGAAIATVLSQLISFFILLWMLQKSRRSLLRLRLKDVSKKSSTYFDIMRSGFPTIMRQMLGSVSSALLNIQAALFGDAAVAAVTIANKIYMLVRNIILGIGQGYQPVAGFNYGAGFVKRVKQAFLFATLLGTSVCLTASLTLSMNAEAVVTWFRNDDPQVIALGTKALLFCLAVMPFMAYSTYVNQLYQCLGFSLQATILASMRQGICFIPLILLLPRYLDFTGLALSQPGADLLTFLVSVPFQLIFFQKVLKEKETP